MCAWRVRIYARFSDNSSSPTSIEDQVRRCREVARRLGIEVGEVVVFSDEEMSGYKQREAYKRPGFRALLAAWDRNEFDVLIVDELSRFARNGRQLLELTERLERGGVRLITANGLDSANPQWRLLLGMHGLMAQEESRGTSHRVKRGMVGQLERGYMIAQCAFGYRSERMVSDVGRALWTIWHRYEPEAEIVRELYRKRVAGSSYAQLAAWLNGSGIKPSRGAQVPQLNA